LDVRINQLEFKQKNSKILKERNDLQLEIDVLNKFVLLETS
jgi:hypothetical protein